jgi:sulfur carrier protein
MVNVYIEKENKTVNLKIKNAREAIKLLNLNPETILIVKNNELILDNEILNENDELKLLSVISGG